MTRSLRALLLAGVATIGLGIMPGLAAAGHGNDRGWGSRGGDDRKWHDRGDRGHKKSHGHDRYVRDSHKHGGHKQHGYRQQGHNQHYTKRDRNDDHLLPAFLIGAVGLTAIVLASQSQAAAPRPQPVTYVQPPAPYPVTVAQAPDWQGASCLMTREYQTQITVGGRLVDAYGQACLQPDGSWLKGPAQSVPY